MNFLSLSGLQDRDRNHWTNSSAWWMWTSVALFCRCWRIPIFSENRSDFAPSSKEHPYLVSSPVPGINTFPPPPPRPLRWMQIADGVLSFESRPPSPWSWRFSVSAGSSNIWVVLPVLRVIPELSRGQGKQDRGRHSPLWCSSTTDQSVRCTALKSREAVCNPSHLMWIHPYIYHLSTYHF